MQGMGLTDRRAWDTWKMGCRKATFRQEDKQFFAATSRMRRYPVRIEQKMNGL